MGAREASTTNPSPLVITEAAAWVARLHGPLRSPAVERGFWSWLQEHPDHGKAWELVTESWDEVAQLRAAANIQVSLGDDRQKRTRRWLPVAFAAATAVIFAIGVTLHFRSVGVNTGVGEQRVVVLEDGTRISLNTLTRLFVQYATNGRHVVLDSGEAYFEVARNPARPFVVSIGQRKITAIGTAFLVRREPQRVAVTLMEGKVVVDSDKAPDDQRVALPSGATTLVPGERATFVAHQGSPTLDRPALETLMAWQRGKIPIDNLSLAEAAAEMNRYSPVSLFIERPEAAQVRVSGIFRAGDSLSFAKAVADNYGLEVQQQPGRIVLRGSPVVAH
jgi:transmembrane sensor